MVSTLDLKALDMFLKCPVSQDMIHKLVVATLQVIPCQDGKSSKYTADGKPLPSLSTYITRLVKYTNVYTGTLMATLVLLNKLKSKLPQNAQGLACTRHRIFLSCLVLSSKYHNDSSPKNCHWAKYTDGLFSLKDVNLMERQLLYLLNWNIKVTNEDMVSHLHKFLHPIKEEMVKAAKIKSYYQKQQSAAARCRSSPTSVDGDSSPRSYSPRSSLSRSSSTASALSLGSEAARDSDLNFHVRQSSCSSVESLSPAPKSLSAWSSTTVAPEIERVARSEEQELHRMIASMSHGSLDLAR